MNCPKCKIELSSLEVRDITIWICSECGGNWLARTDFNNAKAAGNILLEELSRSMAKPEFEVENYNKLNCPVCANVVMMRHYTSFSKQIEIDECPVCGGYWLDAGELEAIQKEFVDERLQREAKKRSKYNFNYIREKSEQWRREEERLREEARSSSRSGVIWTGDDWWCK